MLMVVAGAKGVGKTYTSLKEIALYQKKHQKKVLIFDTNYPYESSYQGFKSVAIENLPYLLKPEVRRVLPLRADGSPMTAQDKEQALPQILDGFSDGLLVLEDINSYLLAPKSVEVINALTTHRHKKMDILLHYQSLSALAPRIWQNCAVLRLHHQIDNVDRYKQRLPNWELIRFAQMIVDFEYEQNKRYFLYLNLYDNLILGANDKTISKIEKVFKEKYRLSDFKASKYIKK